MLSRQHENRRYQKRTHETEILTFRRIDALHSPNFATNSSLDILLLGEVTRYAILHLGHLRLRVDVPFRTWHAHVAARAIIAGHARKAFEEVSPRPDHWELVRADARRAGRAAAVVAGLANRLVAELRRGFFCITRRAPAVAFSLARARAVAGADQPADRSAAAGPSLRELPVLLRLDRLVVVGEVVAPTPGAHGHGDDQARKHCAANRGVS